MTDHIVDITVQNVQQLLIEESFKRPVLVDVWAAWCEPCKTLMPLLEKLANEFAGQFLLAKINADEQPELAAQLNVRSLPTVILIRDGQPVDGFNGMQQESFIRDMLDPHLPKSWDIQLQQALELIASGQHSAALPLLRQAFTDSRKRADIALELAQTLIQLNRLDEAQTSLDAVLMADQDARYQQLVAALELKRESARTPEIQALEAQLQAEPDNLDVAYQLAIQFSQHEHHKEALAILFDILQRDRDAHDGAVKRSLLDVIRTLGNGDPLAAEYQRKLFGLMY